MATPRIAPRGTSRLDLERALTRAEDCLIRLHRLSRQAEVELYQVRLLSTNVSLELQAVGRCYRRLELELGTRERRRRWTKPS